MILEIVQGLNAHLALTTIQKVVGTVSTDVNHGTRLSVSLLQIPIGYKNLALEYFGNRVKVVTLQNITLEIPSELGEVHKQRPWALGATRVIEPSGGCFCNGDQPTHVASDLDAAGRVHDDAVSNAHAAIQITLDGSAIPDGGVVVTCEYTLDNVLFSIAVELLVHMVSSAPVVTSRHIGHMLNIATAHPVSHHVGTETRA